jgi:hypothetical protein
LKGCWSFGISSDWASWAEAEEEKEGRWFKSTLAPDPDRTGTLQKMSSEQTAQMQKKVVLEAKAAVTLIASGLDILAGAVVVGVTVTECGQKKRPFMTRPAVTHAAERESKGPPAARSARGKAFVSLDLEFGRARGQEKEKQQENERSGRRRQRVFASEVKK